MDQEKKRPEQGYQWVKPEEGTAEIYGNAFHVSWTLFDVRVQIGQLIPVMAELPSGFVVEEQGAVTVAWPQAKALRDALNNIVASYENVNGEIKPITLPPAMPIGTEPTVPQKNS